MPPRRPATRPAHLPTVEPSGWTPARITVGESTRAGGLLRGSMDALRGVAERGHGQPLTPAQVSTYTPFFSSEYRLDPAVVRRDLADVRVLTGGPAKGNGSIATTIGHSLYVPDAEDATHILSWGGRRWLAHELGHVMQWRASGAPADIDGSRDRAFLVRYLKGVLHTGDDIGMVAISKALAKVGSTMHVDAPTGKLGDVVHDRHPMEMQAMDVADRFNDATSAAPRR